MAKAGGYGGVRIPGPGEHPIGCNQNVPVCDANSHSDSRQTWTGKTASLLFYDDGS